MPTPTLDSQGRPIDWVESSKIVEDWGTLQIIFNGVDVTLYRGVPAQVTRLEYTEPFSDAVAVVKFPQISPFEALPSWLADWVNVEIKRVLPDTSVETIWEGLYVSEEDAVQAKSEFVAECMGALYQADLFKKQPSFDIDAYDIGTLIAGVLNYRVERNLLRLELTEPTIVGILALNRGSWQPLLTGYIQDLLAAATLATDLAGGYAAGFDISQDGGGYWIASTTGHVIPFDYGTPYYGSMANQYVAAPMTGFAARPQGDGYWLVATDGGVFAFGSAPFEGSVPPLDLNEDASEIEPTPTGLGYWVVAEDGGVFAFGDALFAGSGEGVVSDVVKSMAPTPSGLGYFLVALDGTVYAYGDAVWNGNAPNTDCWAIVALNEDSYWITAGDGSVFAFGDAVYYGGMTGVTLNAPIRDIKKTPTGLGYWLMGADGGIFSFGDAVFHGSVPGGHGVANQYTLHKDVGRQPVIRLKDRITQHWTITVGTPGIKHTLSRDFTMAPNTFYASGTDPDGCFWRNTRYPLLENLDSAFFMPLAGQPEVEPYLYDANGVVLGANPLFDSTKVRVEHFTNFGDMVTKYEGLQSVRADVYRNITPAYQGEIELGIDPEEGSRFAIRAGQNILLKGYRGTDELFHIAKVSLDFESLTAKLTVDQKAQDLLTLSAVNSRDRATVEATKSFKVKPRHGTIVEDRVAVFDCEAGAGKVREDVAAGGWYIWQVPFAERGQIIKTYIRVGLPLDDSEVEPVAIDFGVGVFSRWISMEELTGVLPDGPLVPHPLVNPDEEYNAWNSWGYEEPLVAWGSNKNKAGYWPEKYAEELSPTGVLFDDAQWFYKARTPPWLWVAFWLNGSSAPGVIKVYMDFTPGVLGST